MNDFKLTPELAKEMLELVYKGATAKPLSERLREFYESMPDQRMFESGDDGSFRDTITSEEAKTLGRFLVRTAALIPFCSSDSIDVFGYEASMELMRIANEGAKE